MQELIPTITEKYNGVIWRMETDALTDRLFIETRNTENRLVTFAALDLKLGKTLYKDLALDEKWLTGIESAYNGVLLLHGYQNESSPIHKGLIAVDNTGQILWSNYTYAFDHLSADGPVVYNIQIQPKKLFVIDTNTGNSLKSATGFEPQADNQIKYPEPLSTLDFELPVEPIPNSLHYLAHHNFIIVSLHSVNNEGFIQHLYVLQNGVPVFEDILNRGIQKLQPEAFIVFKNYLVYIKNKSELKVINL